MSDPIRLVLLPLLTASLLAAGCSGGRGERETAEPPDAGAAGDARPTVFVSNYPLQYFSERIGGDRILVESPAADAGDPAFWTPDAGAILRIQRADLIILNGAGYERWIDRVTLPPSKVVDTSAGYADRLITIEDAVSHTHGPEGGHSHGETAFTTWLDPILAIGQSDAIRRALTRARPGLEAEFRSRFELLENDLRAVDRSLRDLFSGTRARPLLASHPVYQYFARAYDLDLASVHFEPGEPPDEEAWRALEELLGEHPAELMLWEGEPLEETVRRLDGLGVRSVVFNPCGNRPGAGDYLTVMRANVDNLRDALSSGR